MYIETQRCVICKFTREDASALHKALSDIDVMRYIEPVFNMKKTEVFIEKYGLCENPLVYALKWRETDEVIGHVVFHPYDERSYEVGWVLNKVYWGKGIANEITKALVQYSTGKADSCIIECDERQAVSRHIAIKNGFEYDGKQDGLVVYRRKLQ